MSYTQLISQEIEIAASREAVWHALTDPLQLQQWMSQQELTLITDWKTGGPFIIRGAGQEYAFENKGILLAMEAGHRLSYTHLSSLSALEDLPQHYTTLTFNLLPAAPGHILLRLDISNFPTEAIYHHFRFYWHVALHMLQKHVALRGY
jgi:uncharacterized protein YndB with AHSA1/START domain